MSNKTKIEWTDMTSNPIHLVREDGSNGGHWCKKISEGCANCYAETQNQSNYFSFASHLKYAGEAPKNLILDEAVLQSWLKLRKPHKIFVCSMTDMFGDWIPFKWIDKIFAYMKTANWHTFQVLTKRPDRMLEYFADYRQDIGANHAIVNWKSGGVAVDLRKGFPLPNVWLGTSIENQKAVDTRIEPLLQTPAKVRFLSCEPLLGEVDLSEYLTIDCYVDAMQTPDGTGRIDINPIDWVIVGGESGKVRGHATMNGS